MGRSGGANNAQWCFENRLSGLGEAGVIGFIHIRPDQIFPRGEIRVDRDRKVDRFSRRHFCIKKPGKAGMDNLVIPVDYIPEKVNSSIDPRA